MPIVFSKEHGGWGLENPSEEEKEDLINYAVQAVRQTLGDELANELIKRMARHMATESVLDSIPTDEMGPAN